MGGIDDRGVYWGQIHAEGGEGSSVGSLEIGVRGGSYGAHVEIRDSSGLVPYFPAHLVAQSNQVAEAHVGDVLVAAVVEPTEFLE